jgi:hypothetical protein
MAVNQQFKIFLFRHGSVCSLFALFISVVQRQIMFPEKAIVNRRNAEAQRVLLLRERLTRISHQAA